MRYYRTIAYALLRVTLGAMFLFYGLGKLLRGIGEFAAGLQERFAGTWLPPELVSGFGHVLPFVEITLGVLLVVGLFNLAALIGAAVLMMVLVVGAVVEPNPATVAHNMLLALVVFVLLWSAGHNAYALDRLRRRRSPW